MSPGRSAGGRGVGGRGAGGRSAGGRGATEVGLGGEQVEGRRAVRELLAAGRRRVRRLWISEGLDPSPQLDDIESWANRRGVRVETVPRRRLESEARTDAPQGVLALAQAVEAASLEDLARPRGRGRDPFVLVVAGVTDPRNLGSLLRSAECSGVTGVVLARHRAARLTPTAVKVAAGAIEHLDFAVAGGIPAALERLVGLGVWTVGLAGEADRSIYDLPLGSGPVALVVGGEERGLAPLVRRRCDAVVSIPQHGTVPSLNVGVAGALGCFEVARQRTVGRS